MLFYKMLLGLLKRDPRFKPLDKTSIPFYDRLMEIIPSLQRKLPSRLSKFLIYRYYLLHYKSPLHPYLQSLKAFRFNTRLYISKQIQEILYFGVSKKRRLTLIFTIFLGIYVGFFLNESEGLPGQEDYALNYIIYPKIHWLLPYILEDVHIKGSPDYFKKDNLALGIDRLMLKGIEDKELDSLNWMVLAAKFASMQETEFSYLAFQMAHFKDHQNIGGNSAQPIEGLEAARFFTHK